MCRRRCQIARRESTVLLAEVGPLQYGQSRDVVVPMTLPATDAGDYLDVVLDVPDRQGRMARAALSTTAGWEGLIAQAPVMGERGSKRASGHGCPQYFRKARRLLSGRSITAGFLARSRAVSVRSG